MVGGPVLECAKIKDWIKENPEVNILVFTFWLLTILDFSSIQLILLLFRFEFEKADKSRVSSDPTIYGGTSTLSGAPGGGGGGGDRGDNIVIRGNFRELKEQEAQETGRKKENSQLLQLLQENRFFPSRSFSFISQTWFDFLPLYLN